MRAYTFGSLFTGIGGLDRGLERAGWTPHWQVEIDPFCRRVLDKHWPEGDGAVARYDDVRTFPPCIAPGGGLCDHGEVCLNPLRVDLICGGFPCQPVSVAGKRLAQLDERWLWPEFARVIRALRPRYVLVENVPGLLIRGFGDVLGDLAASGYDAEWDCIPAAAVGAPHRRDRVWLVAYPNGEQRRSGFLGQDAWTDGRHHAGRGSQVALAESEGLALGERDGAAGLARPQRDGADVANAYQDDWRASRASEDQGWSAELSVGRGWWATEPDVGRVAHGVPARVDRLRSLGNAVVPQVAEWIGRRLMVTL